MRNEKGKRLPPKTYLNPPTPAPLAIPVRNPSRAHGVCVTERKSSDLMVLTASPMDGYPGAAAPSCVGKFFWKSVGLSFGSEADSGDGDDVGDAVVGVVEPGAPSPTGAWLERDQRYSFCPSFLGPGMLSGESAIMCNSIAFYVSSV